MKQTKCPGNDRRVTPHAKIAFLVVVLLAISALMMGMTACSSGGAGSSSAKVFTGTTARDSHELDDLTAEALENVNHLPEAATGSRDIKELVVKASADFSRGNELYRSGDYAAAQEAYESVIEAYPHHAGGNINLTLALLQQEKNEDALRQALACVYLFPDNSGCLLNAQTAGVACGFKTSDIEYSLNRVLSSEPSGKARSVDEVIAESSEITYDQYDYNDVWARIEFELSTQNADSDDQKSTYGVLSDRVSNLAESADPGTDEQQLKEYLSAVGKSLGYE